MTDNGAGHGGVSLRIKRQPLGRGLAALFGETGTSAPDAAIGLRQVPIEAIRPSAFQPRRHFDKATKPNMPNGTSVL